jgi:Phage gp6-like head-tail connector protein
MTQLVNIDAAKRHLRIDQAFTADDERVSEKLEQASGIVEDYCKKSFGNSAPQHVQAATLLVLEALFDGNEEPLSQPVKDLLHREWDPAFA